MATFEEVHSARLAVMSEDERHDYEKARETAELAGRLAQLVYDTRTAAGLSQTELARRMGTTQSAVARMEGGGTVPSILVLDRLAKATSSRLSLQFVPDSANRQTTVELRNMHTKSVVLGKQPRTGQRRPRVAGRRLRRPGSTIAGSIRS